MKLLPWLMLLCFVVGIAPAHADRDIVYAARYYTPPGSHRTSHFHLYRINPDGTGRRQLTFGASDDADPHWSPDGRWIAFLRDGSALCLLRVNSGRVKTLFVDDSHSRWLQYVLDRPCWLPDSRRLVIFQVHEGDTPTGDWTAKVFDIATGTIVRKIADTSGFLLSPDNQYTFLAGEGGDWRIEETRSGRQVAAMVFPRDEALYTPIWLDTQTLVSATDVQESDNHYVIIDRRGRVRRRMQFRVDGPKRQDWEDPVNEHDLFLPIPGDHTHFLSAVSVSNSTDGARYDFYRVEAESGRMAPFCSGSQFVVFSPDGSRFCMASSRETVFYGHWRNGNDRTVWATPLRVGDTRTEKLRTITPGLVWVTGADWRKRQL